MNDLTIILSRIRTKIAETDPATLELVSRVTIDAAALQARALAGEDVTKEVEIVAATARNLDQSVRQIISAEVSAWIQGLLGRALGIAVQGVL